MKIDERAERIRQWAAFRGLYNSGDPTTQFTKLIEEAGETAKAILNGNVKEQQDGIGDMYTVLVNLSHLCGFRIEECIDVAWEDIKNRTGEMKNGTFVKN